MPVKINGIIHQFHIGWRLSDQAFPIRGHALPNVSQYSRTEHLRETGEHDIEQGDLLIFVLDTDISSFGQADDFLAPGEDLRFFRQNKIFINSKALFLILQVKDIIFILPVERNGPRISKPLFELRSPGGALGVDLFLRTL